MDMARKLYKVSFTGFSYDNHVRTGESALVNDAIMYNSYVVINADW